ncbi:MAG: hypothetical protein IJI53_06670 [Clostridia bacterium]|nr:hypothetical protein [Clostridia bacterium]
MSYNQRIGWKDHVVERPRTYTETVNGDGSKTFTAAPGAVIQQGTPQSATNFNTMDEALQHICIAFDELQMTMQAELRAAQDEIVTLKAQVAALAEE